MIDDGQWKELVETLPVGLLVFAIRDEKVEILNINDRLVGLSDEFGQGLDGRGHNYSKDQLTNVWGEDLFAFAVEEDIPIVQQMLKESEEKKMSRCRFRLKGSSEERTVWVRCTCSSQQVSDTERIYYVVFSNITEEVEKTERLIELSIYDALTGVRNRFALDQVSDECNVHPLHRVGMAFADTNGIKMVNDTLGHRYGDDLLCQFKDVLLQEFDRDNIYRISGDEFIILIDDIDEEDFKARMKRVVALVKENDNLASIGYLWAEEIKDLRRKSISAERLMYVEKQKYYATREEWERRRRPKLINQLAEEIIKGNYEMYLQPKAKIGSKEIIGAEALVRKFDDNHQMIFPNDFIPQLEQNYLIPALDFFMLREVCKLLNKWKEEGRRLIKISVNMSRVTIAENDFLTHVLSIVNGYGIDFSYIEFEITESTGSMDHLHLVEVVNEVRKLGFGVSLDDMGADYSALRMLLIEGIDTVKIDRSFVTQMNTESGSILLRHVLGMSHDLKMNCVAEGVEEDEQRKMLEEMGCDMYQGYLLSRPIPVSEFEKLM